MSESLGKLVLSELGDKLVYLALDRMWYVRSGLLFSGSEGLRVHWECPTQFALRRIVREFALSKGFGKLSNKEVDQVFDWLCEQSSIIVVDDNIWRNDHMKVIMSVVSPSKSYRGHYLRLDDLMKPDELVE